MNPMTPTPSQQLISRVGTTRRAPAKAQRGVGFVTLVLYFVVGAVVVLGFLKIVPHYIEYFAIKKVIAAMKSSEEIKTATVAELRNSFDRRANIDNVTSVKGVDLEITKENNETVISLAWTQRIPLFTGYTLLIDFSTSTTDK
jgi:hypothetical protein